MFHDILLAQRREWQGLLGQPYIERSTAGGAALTAGDQRVVVVLGPRRAGKSVYAAHLASAD
jgi:hypothetical protein